MDNLNEGVAVKTSPKDFFLQFGSIVTLYVSVVSILMLLFQVINYAFPDSLDRSYYHDPYSGAVRWAIASLIVIFPIYLFLSYLINKYHQINPIKKELPIRKWLIYLTLFLAGVVITTDLIVLINTFLGGEITARFIWKVISVLVVAGLVFSFYIQDLRGKLSSIGRKTFAYVSILVVIASIVAGFVFIGSPQTQRDIRMDRERVIDLQNIQSTILYQYWERKGELPESLGDLDNVIGVSVPSDPETNRSYVYNKLNETSFEICADFSLESTSKMGQDSLRKEYGIKGEDKWDHPAGFYCFERTIDPDIFPPRLRD